MSLIQEIPAFSIWQTFNETLPTLMSIKPSEKSVEHLAKIIKSGDFSNIFVYNRDPSVSYETYKKIADKYKSFTTWFLGRFFYLLSCERLSKSHSIYVDIQLCILDQLFKSQLYVYNEMAQEYSKALNNLTIFVKAGDDNLSLDVFKPVQHEDLNAKLDLSPVSVDITKRNYEEFLLKVLKLIAFILNQNFDFQSFDAVVHQNLDDLLYLVSISSYKIKLEILSIYIELLRKIEWNSDFDSIILHKMDLFASFFEQIIYEVYNEKSSLSSKEIEQFENLLAQFIELCKYNEPLFISINEFLIENKSNERLIPSAKIKKICKTKRKKPLQGTENFAEVVTSVLNNYDISIFGDFKSAIIKEINDFRYENEGSQIIKLFDNSFPGKWPVFYQLLLNNIEVQNCKNVCRIQTFLEFITELVQMLIEIRIVMHKKVKCIFFDETSLFIKMLSLLNQHLKTCEETINMSIIFNFFLNFSFICNLSSVSVFFDMYTYTFTHSSISQNNIIRNVDYGRYKKELNDFLTTYTKVSNAQELALEYLNKLITGISSGLFELNQIQDMETTYLKICRQIMGSQNEIMQIELIKNLPNSLHLFYNRDKIISEVLIPAFSSSSDTILKNSTKVLQQIICIASSNFTKVIEIGRENGQLKINIFCDKCEEWKINRTRDVDKNCIEINFPKIEIDLSSLTGMILKNLMKFLTFNDTEMKLIALETLPACSNHILKFHSSSITKIWVEKCEDREEIVRKKFGEVVAKILKYEQENKILSDSIKGEVIDLLFSSLMKLTRRSLQQSDYKLQETVLYTIQEISNIKLESTILPVIKILIYLIMIPTSKHSLIAVNKFFDLAKKHDTSTSEIYKQNKQEICEIIVHLCVVNQALANCTLATSLCKISVTLEFYSSKDFVLRECQYLLPFFVSKVIKKESVGELIEEMALMVNVNLSDLIASIYGNIFLHVFFKEDRSDFKRCMLYLEKTTGQSSATLRKRNLWVILNELLLNFHDKRDKVLLALNLLAREENNGTTPDNLQDYLQTRFLGLLQHFDFKLMAKSTSRKNIVLLSLADLFRYMGPKHISPLRFKIIAMLRTADCGGFADLSCEVWNAFVKSCDVESLGPQLATIFVSVLPLMKTCPKQINDIFKYLVIEHENKTKEFIKDLFFIDDPNIDHSVVLAIRKHVSAYENRSLKEKIKVFLKYLTHETLEIRVRSLRHLKLLMEKNREELDQMILGYNGIDLAIVELIDILTSGCKEKDSELKQACGEVIGELGAVEPAHLPRRYAQNSKNFTFFINDDAFIVSALNELTKAFQGEKNTVNMDRFAVAIQETLKIYDIAPDESSNKNHLWKQFPESLQELMLPLLKSRYIIAQPPEANFPTPIYGTAVGASFQSWLYTWTCSLISTLPDETQSSLTPCLPAMKQDYRILMQYLPHILLHSIIDSSENKEKSFIEIKTVTSSFTNKKKIDPEQLDIRPFPVPNVPPTIERVTPDEVKHTQCTKVVFIILDFLNRWIREWQWQKGLAGRNDENFNKVKSFLERFCKLQLAKCNYQCGEYPRALMYLEDYITENPHEISNNFSFLAEIYAQLDEPDGVDGVIALQQTEPSIEQRILALEVSGKLSDAAACYERIEHPLKLHHLQGLIQCYLDLDNVNTALNFARGAFDRQPEFGNMLLEMQAEPLWRLGRYEDLDTLLKQPEMVDNTSWGVQIGRALLSFEKGDRELFENTLQKLKSQQIEHLGAASLEEGLYQHGYSYISRLHALNELQQVEKATYEILQKRNDSSFVESIINHLSKEWELRIKVVQESLRIIEPLLCLRRVAIEQAKRVVENKVPCAVPLLNALLGDCWLLSAKMARAAGVHQQAYTYTLKAEKFAPPKLFLEKAQLHWMREEHEQALTTLKRGLELILPDSSTPAINALPLEKRKLCAEAKLLIASYNDAISNVDTDVKKTNYKESIDMYKEWEKNWVYSAQFYDRIFQNMSDEERDSVGSDLQVRIINNFCRSLEYGTTFVYQSLPRVLSIWFDYGTRLLDVTQSSVREERRNHLVKMSKLIDAFLDRLPAYVFLTAFSQIISRICHPQKEVYVMIKSIVVKLLLHYPQQCLWTIISVMKSDYAVRAKRCAEIFADPELKSVTITKLVKDFTTLAERLIELCNKKLPSDVETTTVSALLRTLPRLLNKPDFSEIMIPTHKFRKLVLPNPDFSRGQHNPFPNHYVHIVGIEEEVTVLRSLQRPRKITFRGSDGKGYIQMLKPKDDLRKDFRLMEFNDIVNHLLSLEPEARQRRLHIRLYSVSPLNEECGLIEWVPNLVGLRPVLLSLYKQRGITMKTLKDLTRKEDPLSKKRETFTKTLLAKHPPILGEWFRRTFPDPQSWVFARTAYIRTTAVISMVGYILGLGDRHGENILLDSICGDTVHVDFNCLFNKGETFEWPERVPFRLTQNMVAAMGPLGVEGMFRKSCACTLRVLRTNANTLMSIVTPFVYDPLVSWPRNVASSIHSTAERTNEQALEHIKNIELRLQGIVTPSLRASSKSLSIPLSVDGQTAFLIKEAMDLDNLCQMYIGWGAYL